MSVFNGPITSGILATVDKVNASASYFAPSGGGGGSSANPSVSSLTLAPGGQINILTNEAGVGTLNLEYNSTTSLGAQIAFQVAPGPAGFLGMNYDAPTSSIYTSYTSETGAPPGLGGGGHSMAFANISSLSVSSINGQLPGGAIPEDLVVNSVTASTLATSTITQQGFIQPLITYGSVTLSGSGTATVGMDREYTDPYYPQVTYRGTLGANTSTLSVSTLAADSFQIWGEANTQVIYTVFGN